MGAKVGNGVFAGKEFRKGEIVEICPLLIDIDKNWCPPRQEFVTHDYYTITYDPYPVGHKPEGWVPTSALMLGYGSLYNHSAKPNCDAQWGACETILFIATRKIRPREELTIDYGKGYWSAHKHTLGEPASA